MLMASRRPGLYPRILPIAQTNVHIFASKHSGCETISYPEPLNDGSGYEIGCEIDSLEKATSDWSECEIVSEINQLGVNVISVGM